MAEAFASTRSAVVVERRDAVLEWDSFLESLDFGALVPEAYERYRPAIVDGLNFFLENLAADRAIEILAEQASMPAGTAIEERLVAIARRCPALHKLGQVLARDRRLPADFRRLLQTLESMPSTLDAAQARRLAEAELGPVSRLGISIEEPPLAEASVAIVVPFTSRSKRVAHGVLKLLKPGIVEKLEEELELLQRIGGLLDERCEAYRLPHIDYEDTFLEVKALLSREICLDREQEHMRHARREFSHVSSVIVPEVYDFSTPRLTAMQRIIGAKVTDSDLPAPGRRKLADTIIQALLARPLWSNEEQAFFHADPHAGNLFATADGELVVLDWSLVGHLTKDDRVQLTQILIGAFTLDASRVCEAIDALAQGRTDAPSLNQIIHKHIGLVSQGAFPGLSWVMRLLDESITRARCRFGGDLLMFRKVLQTLEGVVADVSPDCHPDRVLITAFVKQLVIEWVQRPLALPSSRHFSTHSSNIDLTQLLMSMPFLGSLRWMNLQSTWLRDTGLGWAR
jgi:ubiquinone biosynthesis protein